MSSMLRMSLAVLMLSAVPVAVHAQVRQQPADGREWDSARAQAAQSHDMVVHQSIDRWKLLSSNDRMGFAAYAGFLLTYPGYPQEDRIRGYAERALLSELPDASSVASFFDRFPPISSQAAGRYAAALTTLRRANAAQVAVDAWRRGSLTAVDEGTLLSFYRDRLTPTDHDARMDALLWQGETAQAERQISFISAARRAVFMERLAMVQGSPPGTLGVALPPSTASDAGYLYNRAVQARKSGGAAAAVSPLANRPALSQPVPEPEKWVKELLGAARAADASSAVRIASGIDDAFAPGTDISRLSYRLRDDYTSLVWLGGTKAMWSLKDPRRAAPLFYRYGAAAQTPGTRSKGFYWAGRALAQAGDTTGATRYFEMAAQYPQYFYGQLALERLGRPLPNMDTRPSAVPTSAQRSAFHAQPIARAVRDVARDGDWRTTIQFFREISEQAKTEADHVLVAELAQQIGRRDLAVILGQSAHADGLGSFGQISYPLIPTPPASNWTMVHALTRQESQFAQNALSHAGARGLMQLMPGTAREQAGKMGLSYNPDALTTDASYNIRLGDGYFGRMMDYFGGATPLAVGAYNAGAGNVNKWLAAIGDPRTGAIDWVSWIEQIPIYETKNYIQRVLENAVVYESMYPAKSDYTGANKLSRLMPGKRTPG